MSERVTEHLVGRVISPGNRFQLGEYVTGGSFGSIHHGIEISTGKTVAIKLEKMDVKQPQLVLEFAFYRTLGNARFLPKILFFGPIDDWNALVLELLGPSLANMCTKCGNCFTIETTTKLMLQLLTIFEYVHEHGIVYRDIKPENFLFGRPNTDKWCTVMLIDLGFAKKYLEEDNKHMEFKGGKPLTGTARYISINSHNGKELSRRDDLEALLYMIVYLHKGQLPWQGVQAENIRERYRQIGMIKVNTKPAELCREMPSEYAAFITHVKKLQFEERPNYRAMNCLFQTLLVKLGTSMDEKIYDWNEAQMPKNAQQQ